MYSGRNPPESVEEWKVLDRDKEVMEAVEDSVGAGRGTVVGMKWMKNPQHWKQGQRYAHLILTTTNRMVTNMMIRREW